MIRIRIRNAIAVPSATAPAAAAAIAVAVGMPTAASAAVAATVAATTTAMGTAADGAVAAVGVAAAVAVAATNKSPNRTEPDSIEPNWPTAPDVHRGGFLLHLPFPHPSRLGLQFGVAQPAGPVDFGPGHPPAGHIEGHHLDSPVGGQPAPHLHRRPLRQLRRQPVDPALPDRDAPVRLPGVPLQHAYPHLRLAVPDRKVDPARRRGELSVLR